jgi:hypothetical protein
MTDITISNVHERGFAFAVTPTGEQVFIPPHTLAGNTLRAGDTIKAVLVVNPSDRSAHGTPWMAVRLDAGEETIAHVTDNNFADDINARDKAVLETVNENVYVTTSEIATTVGIDAKSAGNSALRLFNAGKIAKADVYAKPGQARSSFTLWAADAKRFVEEA